MNENPVGVATANSDLPQDVTVDQSRRRLGALGVTGSAVLMSLSSKSAVAGWGSCTGSELASGNLSKAGTANPCGCSPGFWWNKNGETLRGSAPSLLTYPFSLEFNTYFGRNFLANANTTFQMCGPGANPATNPLYKKAAPTSTAMHAIAALLNAAYYGGRYPVLGLQTAAAVKTAFQLAYDNGTLTDFVTRVDVYKTGVWCNGADHPV
jgi:hypothetical protein